MKAPRTNPHTKTDKEPDSWWRGKTAHGKQVKAKEYKEEMSKPKPVKGTSVKAKTPLKKDESRLAYRKGGSVKKPKR